MSLSNLKKELASLADRKQALVLQNFFKTGKGEYGEGDIFIGVSVPNVRKIVKEHNYSISLKETEKLLESKIHEERLAAILLLVHHFELACKGSPNCIKEKNGKTQKEIFEFYMNHSQKINNWDLVDLSAPKISGPYLLDKPRDILYDFAKSENLWKRRIAIISTLAFIRNRELEDTFALVEILLHDRHDLMHKACGWMLREAGKRDQPALEVFLKKHYQRMPRTMLRYAIEKFDEKKRKQYLGGEI